MATEDHRVAGAWREVAGEDLCVTPHLAVRKTIVASPMRPGGRPWLVVRRKRAVVVIPRTAEGKFVMVRQERPAVRELLCEFPAGQVDGGTGEEHLRETALSELREETGMVCSAGLRKLGGFYSSPGFTDEHQTIFLAEGAEVVDETPEGDPHSGDEAIAGLVFLDAAELRRWVLSGRIHDANSLVCFALLSAHGEI